MGRVGTIYDQDLHEKVYVIKGDERYVHSTEILLTQTGNITQDTSSYSVPFVITTHRNLGASTITVYDNGEVIDVLDCNTADATINYTASLVYDVEHNIYVRYNANNQCTPSKSFIWTDMRENPNLSVTTLTQSGSLRFSSNETATTTVTITEESGTVSVSGLTLEYSIDGGAFIETTTDSNGDATINMGQLTNGTHTVAVYFNGTSSLSSSDIQFQAVVGFDVEIIEYPPAFVNILDWDYGNTVKVKVLDYLGEPVEGGTVSFYSQNKTTNSDGIAIFRINNGVGGSYYATYGDYTSEDVTIGVATVSSITLSQENVVEKGTSTECTWKLNGNGNLSDILLKVQVVDGVRELYSASKYTDANGEITFTYEGDGRGEVISTVGTSSTHQVSASILDYLQYWKAPTVSRNKSTYSSYCALESLSNGWKLKASSNIHRGAMTFTNLPTNFRMTFKIVSVRNYNGLRINDTSYPFEAGQNVTIKQNGRNGSIYVNGTLVSGHTSDEQGTLKLWVNYNQYTSDSWIVYDNLRILPL